MRVGIVPIARSLAILTVALLASNAQAVGSRLTKPDFSVAFPEGFPEPTDQPVTGGRAFVSGANGVLFMVETLDQPIGVTASTADLGLRTLIRRSIPDAEVGEFEAFAKSNCPAMSAISVTAERVIRIQAVINGRRVYILGAQGAKRDAVSSPAVDAFFRSLILTNPCELAPKPAITLSGVLDTKPPFSATYPQGYSSPEGRSVEGAAQKGMLFLSVGPAPGSALSIVVMPASREEIGASAPAFVNKMLHEYADTRVKIESEEAFTRRGEPGKRAFVQRGPVVRFERLEVLLSGEKVFLIEYIVADREALNRPEVKEFFESFRPAGSTP